MDSGLIELMAILAPTIGGQIQEYIKGRGSKIKYTELQILLLAKSIEDTTLARESIMQLNILLQNYIQASGTVFKSIQVTLEAVKIAMETITDSQRKMRAELIESGVTS